MAWSASFDNIPQVATGDIITAAHVNSMATAINSLEKTFGLHPDVKPSVRAATTADITLSGLQTIDGVVLAANDRVLVKNQTTASENSIYKAQSGAWVRAEDCDDSDKVTCGMFTFIEEDSMALQCWILSTQNPIVLGTTALTFQRFTGAPTQARYILQAAHADLSMAQSLGALTTGLMKNTVSGGVSTVSTAVEGTDFYAPGGTDVAVADGGTGAGTAAGARSNLGAAPNSARFIVQESDSELYAEQSLGALSTGLLKNTVSAGVGTLSTATEGTDFYAPGGADVAISDGGTGASTAATARTNLDVPSKAEVQNGSLTYAADAGSSDAYAISLSPAPGAYSTGMVVTFKANTANTGPATLNVNSLGAKDIKKLRDQDLETGDIEAGQLVTVAYDGTAFQMQSQVASLPAGAVLTGSILPYAGGSAPAGYLLCNGAAVSRTTYADLFAVCGTAYGAGDGTTTFNLPDLRGRSPMGDGTATGGSTNRVRGTKYGSETHALSVAEMPAHSHTMNNATNVVRNVVGGSISFNSGPFFFSTSTLSTNNNGSGSAHENTHPVQAVSFIIKT